jgi:predicted MPP superfamily phosphohydrolase
MNPIVLALSRRELMKAAFASWPAQKLRGAMRGAADGNAPTLMRWKLPVPGLDRRLDGLRIGQLSDVHIGATLTPAYVRTSMAVFGRHPPDVLTITGDLMDDPSLSRVTFDLLTERPAPYGTFYSLGNHENFQDRPRIIDDARKHDRLRLLLNEGTTVNVQGATVHISGVDYPVGQGATAPRDDENRRNADVATLRASDAEFRLALAHHPDDFDFLAARGVDLTLSGHTHGGQVAPIGNLLQERFYKYFYGRYSQGRSTLYVNGGTGHSFPLRVGVPAEVTEITLVRV